MTNSTGVTYRCRNDESRTMEAISENCLDLTGYRASQLIGNGEISYAELVHPEDRAALRSHMQAALRAKRPFRHAYRLITAAKEEKWVWEQGVGVFSPEGGLLAVEGLLVDAADELLAYETLEKRVDERTRELSTLLEVSRNVASTLELQPLLGLILEQLGTVIDYSVAAVFHLSGEDLAVLAYRGPVSLGEMVDLRFRLRESQAHQAVVLSRKPRIISDIRGDAPLARAFQEWAGGHLQTIFNYGCSWMGVPLVARERTVGMLSLYHREPDHFTPRLGQLALAFANEAAVAIANARLYAQAEQAAAAAERNRLARDLHDAVTQTLFSASLTAEVLPQLWTRDPAEGERRLEELRQATRGALAERWADHLRRYECRDLLHHLFDRAGRKRPQHLMDRDRYRSSRHHARWGQELDRRHRQPSRPTARRPYLVDRGFTDAAGHRVCGNRPPPFQRLRPVRLRDLRLRQDVDERLARPTVVRSRRARGPAQPERLVRRHGERDFRFARSRRALDRSAAGPAARSGLRSPGAAARQRSDSRYARPGLLHPRRPYADSAVGNGPAAFRVPIPADAGIAVRIYSLHRARARCFRRSK